jgi:hypothetical protein
VIPSPPHSTDCPETNNSRPTTLCCFFKLTSLIGSLFLIVLSRPWVHEAVLPKLEWVTTSGALCVRNQSYLHWRPAVVDIALIGHFCWSTFAASPGPLLTATAPLASDPFPLTLFTLLLPTYPHQPLLHLLARLYVGACRASIQHLFGERLDLLTLFVFTLDVFGWYHVYPFSYTHPLSNTSTASRDYMLRFQRHVETSP